MAAPNVTGDRARVDWKTIAHSLELPVVIDAAGIAGTNTILKKDHAINQAAYGKRLGAAIIVVKADGTAGGIAVAQGSLNTSKWGIVKFDAANDITPA